MKFITDPAVIARVRQLTLRDPDLNVLRPTKEGNYAALVQRIEADLKRRDAEGRLLLPDLRALANRSVGIFSDYGGESGSRYLTYSFLVCAYDIALGPFATQMKKIRADYKLGDKEIAFKDFGMGQMKAALPSYLDALNGYVPGFLLTLVIDSRITSVFGPVDKKSRDERTRALREFGFNSTKHKTIEKALRVTHTAAYLTALLSHQGQKLFWMPDHDAICANQATHDNLLKLFQNVLGLYTTKTFPLLGSALPFAERDTRYLDLLSAADVTAGTLAQYFTDRDAVGEQDARVKEGAEQVLLWLCHDGLGLKKLCLLMRLGNDGTLVTGLS
jgi:hypothetical protein